MWVREARGSEAEVCRVVGIRERRKRGKEGCVEGKKGGGSRAGEIAGTGRASREKSGARAGEGGAEG